MQSARQMEAAHAREAAEPRGLAPRHFPGPPSPPQDMPAQLGRHVHLPVPGEVADGQQEVGEARLHVLHVREERSARGPQRRLLDGPVRSARHYFWRHFAVPAQEDT